MSFHFHSCHPAEPSRGPGTLAARLGLLVACLVADSCAQDTSAEARGEPATEDAPDAESGFLRFRELDARGANLETAIVKYEDGDARRVDLIAVVHIADTPYYELLNRLFRSYDGILYELVLPKALEGKAPDFSRRKEDPWQNESAIGMLQRSMKNLLDLDFQLDVIDYQAPNFVHADLDAETFAEKQEEAGESLLTLMLRAMMKEWAKGSDDPDASMADQMAMLLAALSSERAYAMKYVLGEQFGDLEKISAGFGGPEGSVLLEGRNEAAIAVLKERLEAGDRKLAIFYGAAHMPDLEKRLLDELGFEKVRTHWLEAWKIRPRAD
jgi:hypothetical protein